MQMITSHVSLKLCKKPTQLHRIYALMKNSTGFMTSYQQPCIELMTPINVQETRATNFADGLILLTIPYATETFQETQNVKDFSLESMWSSAGGFVGIFVGYSLLQVPELFDFDWKGYWKNTILFDYLAKLFGFLAACLAGKGNIYAVFLYHCCTQR